MDDIISIWLDGVSDSNILLTELTHMNKQPDFTVRHGRRT